MSIVVDTAMSLFTWTLSKLGRCAAVPLRLIVGYGFMAHGYAKIVHGPEHFISIPHAIGVPAPELMGWATILVELVGGPCWQVPSCRWSACPWRRFCW